LLYHVVYYSSATAAATAVLYGLWWLHNPYPFGAALLGGICVVLYDTILLSYRREQHLRIKMLEERVEELEANEDALYD